MHSFGTSQKRNDDIDMTIICTANDNDTTRTLGELLSPERYKLFLKNIHNTVEVNKIKH